MATVPAVRPEDDPGIADWDLAAAVGWRTAAQFASGQERSAPADVDRIRADLERAVAAADPVARAVAGLGADLPPASVRVVGRRRWIRDNLDSIRELTAPLSASLAARRSPGSRSISRRAVGFQLGVVFGYLSTKVLGQYEVFLPGGEQPGRLTLVGPNMLEVERSILPDSGVSAQEFQYGVCLHELAHRLQFEGVPWLRPHLRGLLDAYLSDARVDPERIAEILERLAGILKDPGRLADPARLLEVVLTPTQAEIIKEAQALMTLLEGHGNAVMDWGAAAGGDLDPTAVRTVLQRRRTRGMDKAMRAALGLSMKAEQYAVGERFILDVADRHGREAFERVWLDPAHVPRPDEFTDPDGWVARVASA